jgi:hypothetical protein
MCLYESYYINVHQKSLIINYEKNLNNLIVNYFDMLWCS